MCLSLCFTSQFFEILSEKKHKQINFFLVVDLREVLTSKVFLECSCTEWADE